MLEVKCLNDCSANVNIPAEELGVISRRFTSNAIILSLVFDNSHPPDVEGPLLCYHVDMNEQFTDEELCIALRDLNASAATGPQGVPYSLIKLIFENPGYNPCLLALMNSCFNVGGIPKEWCHSEVLVLFKGKGSDAQPGNYRRINILNDFIEFLNVSFSIA